jgi:hypothetical protein
MSTVALPIDGEKLSREFAETSSEQQKEIAESVLRQVVSGPQKRESDVPDLLDLKGVLRKAGDESERPGTTALMESRERDERKDKEMLERLRSDE